MTKAQRAALTRTILKRRYDLSLNSGIVESTRLDLRHWVQTWVDTEPTLATAFDALAPFTVILLKEMIGEMRPSR